MSYRVVILPQAQVGLENYISYTKTFPIYGTIQSTLLL